MKARGRGWSERGAALLEVVLALILFVAAAAIVTGGFNAALNSVERIRLNVHAANLAASVLAELQMGARSLQETGPADFDPPFEQWSWELQSTPLTSDFGQTNELVRVEVIIRHTTPPLLVHRLCQTILPVEPGSETTGSEETTGQGAGDVGMETGGLSGAGAGEGP